MKRHAAIILILSFTVLVCCTSESPLAPENDLLVIQAYLYAGEPVNDIRLTTTLPLGSEDSNAPPVNNATVALIKNNVRYELQPSPGDSGFYHYAGNDLIVRTGDIFRLEVFYNGGAASGETAVPPPPEKISISSSVLIYPVNIQPGFGFGGFSQSSAITLRWKTDGASLFYVSVKNIESNPQPAGNFNFPFMRRNSFISSPTSNDSLIINFRTITHLGKHSVKIYRINQEYADLYQSRNQDSRDLNEPLTNIVNGLGVFSAFNSDSLFFEVRY